MRYLPTLALITVGLLATTVDGAELTALGSYRFGEIDLESQAVCIANLVAPCPTEFSFDGQGAYALILDVALNESWMIEIYAQHYESDMTIELDGFSGLLPIDFGSLLPGLLPGGLDLNSLFDDFSLRIPASLELQTLQLGLMRVWNGDRVQPFVALDAGITEIEASLLFVSVTEERPSASLAAGVKVPIGERWAVRLEARTHWVDLPSEISDDDLFQLDAGAGLTLRW